MRIVRGFVGLLGLSVSAVACSGSDVTALDSEAAGEELTSAAELALSAGVAEVDGTGSAALRAPVIEWADCGAGFECATVQVPKDYARPRAGHLSLAVTRLPASDPAARIGSLFVNFGGPGGAVVQTLQGGGKELFTTLNQRFDIVGFDPRGVGLSEGALDCKLDQEASGLYGQPFATPFSDRVQVVARAKALVAACVARNAEMLPYVATADVARDMDLLRSALGERKLSYLGFSWGSFLGSTYASLFPGHYRALVLDGALDADEYINRPSEALLHQSAGFEQALEHFFQACASDQVACAGFGGSDPRQAFDDLVAQLGNNPLPTSDGRVLDADDLVFATSTELYGKQFWPELAQLLADLAHGDPTLARTITDLAYGRNDDGSYGPGGDAYYLLGAAEQRYSPDVQTYLDEGEESWGLFPHAWWNAGYSELPLALLPIRAKNVFRGPFRAAASSPSVLVVATTYDPATPYRGSELLLGELGNAVLLTMQGDGHTAYGGNSSCIDSAVETYLELGIAPAEGTVCKQEVPFAPLAVSSGGGSDSGDTNLAVPGSSFRSPFRASSGHLR